MMDFFELILSKTFNRSKQPSVAEHRDHDTSDLHPGISTALKLTCIQRERDTGNIEVTSM